MRATLLICLAACGGSGGGNPGTDASTNLDAKVFMDAPPVVPMMITISGKTTERGISGETNVSGATVELFASSNESTPLATATSDASGGFSLTVTTNGMPLDGYVRATKASYVDIYSYPTGPFIASEGDVGIDMMTPSNKDFLNQLAGGNQMAGKGLIGLQIRDASGTPVKGATITSSPAGTYRYTNDSGLPSSNATATSADGVAFVFNAQPTGMISVSATKSGMTFKSHAILARGDKMTTTSITP